MVEIFWAGLVITQNCAQKSSRLLVFSEGRHFTDSILFDPLDTSSWEAESIRYPVINLSDEELEVRWSDNTVWQFISGMDFHEHRLSCDGTQIGRFRRDLGEEGLELLRKAAIDTAVAIDAVNPKTGPYCARRPSPGTWLRRPAS